MKSSTARRSYPNSPIHEALCEFQFSSAKPWDLTIPGLVYEKVKDSFPTKKNLQMLTVEVRFSPAGLEQKVEPLAPRMQFLSRDEKRVLQVGPDLLVVNHLKPYSSWEQFKPLILDALHKYDEVASPQGFKRIGLRYVNKIDFPTATIELQDYFLFYPETPEQIVESYSSFFSRVEFPYVEERDVLLVTISSAAAEKPETVSVVLDLDYVLSRADGIQKENVEEWIENAHTTIESAFEACVTDKARKLFAKSQQ